MDWITVSLAAMAVFSVVSVADKIILVRYVPSAPTFIVLVGLLQLIGVLVALLISPIQSYPIQTWIVALASGLLWGISLVIMLSVLETREVSRVIPIYQTSPIFVALGAMLFLAERLTIIHWIAILLTVTGAALVSIRRGDKSQRVGLDSSILILLAASALVAGAQFLSKVALQDMTFWNLYVARTAGLSLACILIPLRRSFVREALQALSNRVGLMVLVLTEGVVSFLAQFLTLWAIALGPVSLTVTVMSSRPLLVFAISVLLSSRRWRLLDEPLKRDILTIKLVSTIMIVTGISIISMLRV